jgi:hypothetical protein
MSQRRRPGLGRLTDADLEAVERVIRAGLLKLGGRRGCREVVKGVRDAGEAARGGGAGSGKGGCREVGTSGCGEARGVRDV